jgi:hypothetical protein
VPGWLSRIWGNNRFSGRDVVGNAVIGDVSGILIQNIGAGSPAALPSLPWRDLSLADGPLGELDIFNLLSWRSRLTRTLVGRDADHDRLIAWACDDRRPIAIRLLTGPTDPASWCPSRYHPIKPRCFAADRQTADAEAGAHRQLA